MISSQPALWVLDNGSGRVVLRVILPPHYHIYSLLAGTFTPADNLVIAWHQYWHHTDTLLTPYWHLTMTPYTSGARLYLLLRWNILFSTEQSATDTVIVDCNTIEVLSQWYLGSFQMTSQLKDIYIQMEEAVKIPATHTRIIRQRGANTSKNRFPLYPDCDCTSQLKYLNLANTAVNIPSSP